MEDDTGVRDGGEEVVLHIIAPPPSVVLVPRATIGPSEGWGSRVIVRTTS